jgi:hypothetical protein
MTTLVKKILPAAILFSFVAMALIPLGVSADKADGVESPPDTLCTDVSHDLSHLIDSCEPGSFSEDMDNAQLCCLLDLMETLVDYVFVILIILAGLMIIWGAFLFVTAAGDSDKINAARDRLIWALVGVGVALAARGLVKVVEFLIT